MIAYFALFIAAVTAAALVWYILYLEGGFRRGEDHFQRHEESLDTLQALWHYHKERMDAHRDHLASLGEMDDIQNRYLGLLGNYVAAVMGFAKGIEPRVLRRRPLVLFQRLPSGTSLPLPSYQTAGASGMDLCASYDMTIPPGLMRIVGTGFRLKIDEGFEGQVRSRSGLARNHQVVVLNQPGTIDSDYTGEILCLLKNLGEQPVTIERGDRIAQLVVTPLNQACVGEVDELPSTVRGEGGFGSTGRGELPSLPLEPEQRAILRAKLGLPRETLALPLLDIEKRTVETVIIAPLPPDALLTMTEEDFTDDEVEPGCDGFFWLNDNVTREKLGLPPVPVD